MAVVVLLSSAPKLLLAQQMYPAQPGYSQSAPYYGQYTPPVQRSAYGQPQTYGQQPYSQQPYSQAYTPPSSGYGYGQGYPQQPYAQQPYQAPAQGYPQQYPQQAYGQAQSNQQSLNADQLEQLVAPIALYPDTLVAQMLAASTYPAQVMDADRWLQSQGNASPYQIAGGADVQNWDPSVKALTAFPQVLAEMDRNSRWTTDLGNAYYNQPQDVLEAVQVMRQRAQAAGNLQSSPQEQVNYDQGAIELTPPNPQTVYVPNYNPWSVYGDPVSPYPGFSLAGALGSFFDSGLGSSALQYGLGIAMGAFNHTPWGWLGWGLNWLTQSVLFNHSDYASHSTTVADWGLPRGGMHAFAGHGGMGGPRNGYGYARSGGGYAGASGPGAIARPRGGYTPADRYNRQAPQSYNKPTMEAFNRTSAPISRPQTYAPRSESRLAYGPEAYGGTQSGYGNPMQAYRSPSETFQHNDFGGRNSGSFATEKAPKSGGFHLFGSGNHEPKMSGSQKNFAFNNHEPKMSGGGRFFGGGGHEPKMPKMSGGGKSLNGGGHSSGGGHSGGHRSGKHHW